MNAPKWTPGPWYAHWSETGGYDCMTSGFDITTSPNEIAGLCIANLDQAAYGQKRCVFAGPISQAEANARLIAAAPDLAEALEALLEIANGSGIPPSNHVMQAGYCALAKAKGAA